MEFLRITLVDMQTFIETYQYRSFSDASKALFVSRQSVARNIEHIEEIIGVPLFLRTTNGIEPTPHGEEFYKRCLSIVNETQDLLHFMKDYSKEVNQTLNFGVNGYSRSTLRALNVLDSFLADHPEVTVNRIDIEDDPFPTVLKEKNIDVTYVNLNVEYDAEKYTTLTLDKREFLLLVRNDHPFAQMESVPIEMLEDKTIVLLTKYNIPPRILSGMTEAAGVKPRKVITTADVNVIRFGIVDNSFISFQTDPTASMLKQIDPRIVSTHLDPPMMRRSGLLYKAEGAPDICYKMLDYFKNNY